MKFDLNKSRFSNTNDTKYKFAIIGAGAAGVTIARKVAEKGHNVALMEGGEDGFTEDSQNLYKGKVVGDPYFELDHCRLRMFGGSTNCWGGMCREFENIDFQRGNFGPEFQWPIVKSDIDKYINEASDILDIDLIKGDKTLENAGLKEVFFDTSLDRATVSDLNLIFLYLFIISLKYFGKGSTKKIVLSAKAS